MNTDFSLLFQYVGDHVSLLDITCDGYWPVVDLETLMITNVVDKDNTEGLVLADLVDGELVINDHSCQFLVENVEK